MASEYWELLRDPRWQEKRLEVIAAAGWCEECHVIEGCIFHVHHTYYEFGKKPWEYPNESLRCLCENCHDARHKAEKELRKLLLSLNAGQIISLIETVRKLKRGQDNQVLSRRYSEFAEDWFEEDWTYQGGDDA